MQEISVAMFDPSTLLLNQPLEKKIEILREQFQKAYQLAMKGINDPDEVLFIFVCPEYALLNDQNTHSHSYTKEEFSDLEKAFTELTSKYPNSLIIPGTTYIEKQFELNDPDKTEKYKDYIYYSQPRLSANKEENFEKTLNQKLFVKNTASLFFKNHMQRYHKKISSENLLNNKPVFFYKGNATSIFSIDNVRFGVEICVDHNEGTLLKEQEQQNNPPIDVQIILANVTAVNPDAVVNYGKDAIIINCSGYFSTSATAKNTTGVFFTNEHRELVQLEMDECSNKMLQIYSNIPLLRQIKDECLTNNNNRRC